MSVRLVGSDGPGKVRGSHGLSVGVADGLQSEADVVIVPGGGWNAGPDEPGARAATRGELPARLAALHAGGATIASVCTGG
jgi:putative intracellular protease/amidase